MTGKLFKTCAIGMVVVASYCLMSIKLQAAVTFRTVALSGAAAADTNVGVTFNHFSDLAINQAGDVAFRGFLSGNGINDANDSGIWSITGNSQRLIAREGEHSPGTAEGVAFDGLFSTLQINGAGQTTFGGTVIGAGVDETNNTGIWTEGSGSLSLIARTGDMPPGTSPGSMFSAFSFSFDRIVSNSSGEFAFSAAITDPSTDSTDDAGFWSGSSASPNLVARNGDIAPGAGQGQAFSRFNPASINELGQTVWSAFLEGPNVDSTNHQGIWSDESGSLSLIARTGEAAIGTGPEVVYSGFGTRHSINSAGQIAFRAFLTGQGINDTNRTGVWLSEGSSLNLIVQEGEDAPGTSQGVVFGGIGDPLLNESGHIAFESRLDGTGIHTRNDIGLWLVNDGKLQLIAREGDQAPGTPEGVVFGRVDHDRTANPFMGKLLNSSGQMIIMSLLVGPGVDNSNNRGIWVIDPKGEFTLVARTGDEIDINESPLIEDLRTISFRSIGFAIGSGGRGTSFNDAGQLLFRAGFTDGTSGIFVATIPEPTSLALLTVGAMSALRRRRFRA